MLNYYVCCLADCNAGFLSANADRSGCIKHRKRVRTILRVQNYIGIRSPVCKFWCNVWTFSCRTEYNPQPLPNHHEYNRKPLPDHTGYNPQPTANQSSANPDTPALPATTTRIPPFLKNFNISPPYRFSKY